MKKIAFLKIGSFSGINDFTLKMLKTQFPHYEIEVIDVFKDLIKYRTVSGVWAAVKEFGVKVLWNNYGTAVLRTSDSFKKAQAAVRKRLEHGEYIFTFQMNSFFDLSVPGVPHFVYTDGTQLSIARQFVGQDEPLWPGIVKEIRSVLSNRNPEFLEHVRSRIAMSIQKDFVRDPLKLGRERAVFHNAAAVFTMSHDVRESVVNDYGCPDEKVLCVYQGSHLPPSSVDGVERYKKKNILFVGREWERKGGPELAAAFNLVKKAHPDATLTIVGCRPKIHVNGCFVVGEIPLEQVAAYYEEASVLCVPSRVEAFGNVFVEALHFKLPIVSTRIGALPDFVIEGENGYLVDPGNSDQLAKALIQLLDDPKKCHDFGNRGYALAQEKYTWETVGKKIRENIRQSIQN